MQYNLQPLLCSMTAETVRLVILTFFVSFGQSNKITCFTGNRACHLTSARKRFNILITFIMDRFFACTCPNTCANKFTSCYLMLTVSRTTIFVASTSRRSMWGRQRRPLARVNSRAKLSCTPFTGCQPRRMNPLQ